jgi:hypothetical protein
MILRYIITSGNAYLIYHHLLPLKAPPPPVSDVGSEESVVQMSSLVGEKSSTTQHNCTEESSTEISRKISYSIGEIQSRLKCLWEPLQAERQTKIKISFFCLLRSIMMSHVEYDVTESHPSLTLSRDGVDTIFPTTLVVSNMYPSSTHGQSK